MRVVLQRVTRASVTVQSRVTGAIDSGVLLLVGIHKNDRAADAQYLAAKCAELRVFPDEQGKMNRSLADISGSALVVSQFTLLGDCSKGRRPSYSHAAPPELARALYDEFVEALRRLVPQVHTGIFGAEMQVELVNDGPVTLILETEMSPGSAESETRH